MLVTSDTGSVVRAFVMVLAEPSHVETIDYISALQILLSKMGCTVSKFLIFTELVERPV